MYKWNNKQHPRKTGAIGPILLGEYHRSEKLDDLTKFRDGEQQSQLQTQNDSVSTTHAPSSWSHNFP